MDYAKKLLIATIVQITIRIIKATMLKVNGLNSFSHDWCVIKSLNSRIKKRSTNFPEAYCYQGEFIPLYDINSDTI